MTHVCLRSMASDGCVSGKVMFKIELGVQLFSSSGSFSICMCFISVKFDWGKGSVSRSC